MVPHWALAGLIHALALFRPQREGQQSVAYSQAFSI